MFRNSNELCGYCAVIVRLLCGNCAVIVRCTQVILRRKFTRRGITLEIKMSRCSGAPPHRDFNQQLLNVFI